MFTVIPKLFSPPQNILQWHLMPLNLIKFRVMSYCFPSPALTPCSLYLFSSIGPPDPLFRSRRTLVFSLHPIQASATFSHPSSSPYHNFFLQGSISYRSKNYPWAVPHLYKWLRGRFFLTYIRNTSESPSFEIIFYHMSNLWLLNSTKPLKLKSINILQSSYKSQKPLQPMGQIQPVTCFYIACQPFYVFKSLKTLKRIILCDM